MYLHNTTWVCQKCKLWFSNVRILLPTLDYFTSWSFIFLNMHRSKGTESVTDINLAWQRFSAMWLLLSQNINYVTKLKKNQCEKEHFLLKVNFQLFQDTKAFYFIYFFPGNLINIDLLFLLNTFLFCCGLTPAGNQTPQSHSLTPRLVG